MKTTVAHSTPDLPYFVSRPAEARIGDYVEEIHGAKDKPEVTLHCRHNPEDIWTHTPCTFALTRHPNDKTKKAYRRID